MYKYTHKNFGIHYHDPDHYDYFRIGAYIMNRARDYRQTELYEEMRSAIKRDLSMDNLVTVLYPQHTSFTTPPANRDSILGTYSLDKQISLPKPYNKFLTARMTLK